MKDSLLKHSPNPGAMDTPMYNFKPSGICANEITFDLIEGKVHNVSFKCGCSGNLKAIGILAEGMDGNELAKKLSGLTCGIKETSCGDQLSKAIASAINKPAMNGGVLNPSRTIKKKK